MDTRHKLRIVMLSVNLPSIVLLSVILIECRHNEVSMQSVAILNVVAPENEKV
jgi:hypothetical protein